MKRVLVVMCFLALLPCLMGASCTLTAATPNPNGIPNRLNLSGSYTVAQTEMVVNITGSARLQGSNPPQITLVQATGQGINGWQADFTAIAPATYICCGILKYMKQNDPNNYYETSATQNATVQ